MLYLDYQATTPVDPRVAERIHHYMVTEFGNPSSSHETNELFNDDEGVSLSLTHSRNQPTKLPCTLAHTQPLT